MKPAFSSANILLPKNVDMNTWSVVACDQYTSEPEYWDEVYKKVGDKPSTLNLILPELYLEEPDVAERIEKIHAEMNEYINSNIFEEYKNAMIYVERVQSNGIVRAGIIGNIDLEKYCFEKGSTSQVRATEATVIERIPPRIKVRENAPLELPHIMILIDDEENTVIEPLSEYKSEMKKLYDFSLMQGGGSISGYLIDEIVQRKIIDSLSALGDKDKFNKKYGLENMPVLLFAKSLHIPAEN